MRAYGRWLHRFTDNRGMAKSKCGKVLWKDGRPHRMSHKSGRGLARDKDYIECLGCKHAI